jgi:hypothetical protein
LTDNENMLTTSKNPTKRPAEASVPAQASTADLEFLSANQQLEGFPGKITETVSVHQPDMRQIAESARRFGAQVPTEVNRQQPPVLPVAKR